MAATQDGSLDKGYLCLSTEQVIVSAKGDCVFIPHKALSGNPLTPQRQSTHKAPRFIRPSTLEPSDPVIKRSIPRYPSHQDANRRDSKLPSCDTTTPSGKVDMPPSPPGTPTASSVYSRGVMDTPSPSQKKNGRTIPYFPRYGQPTTKYPRRPRVVIVRYIPENYEQRRDALPSEQSSKDRTKHFSLETSSVVMPKETKPLPEVPAQKAENVVPVDDVVGAFIDAHVAMPCVTNSLRHRLICGHTIHTAEPEVCGKNCKGPYDSGQLRDRDTPFECMQCITNHIQDMQYGRLTMFMAELSERAKMTDKSSQWIQDKIGFMKMAWRDEDLEEMRSLYDKGKGRYCQPLWIEPEMQDLVDAANKTRPQTAARSRSEQYTSPMWAQRSTPDPFAPRSRMSIEDRADSRRSSTSTVAMTHSRVPSLQRSVTRLFTKREKEETRAPHSVVSVGDSEMSNNSTTLHIGDGEEIELTLEFERVPHEDRKPPRHDFLPSRTDSLPPRRDLSVSRHDVSFSKRDISPSARHRNGRGVYREAR